MTGFSHKKLTFLVVDDFNSFRSTVNSMLMSLGASQVSMAGNGAEALELCRRKKFDVILCDYDLGPGKNGQRVLESLRHHQLIDRESIFVLISADVSKQAVMAAYDCTPDDYLAKPINAHMLDRRIGRLLDQRDVLRPAYKALENSDPDLAMSILTKIALAKGKASLGAQKFLGELFIEHDELNKAEKLYLNVLENKPLDWAKLGLAYVQQARGNYEKAGEVFTALTQENPLYLPAYDGMASNWYLRSNHAKLQDAIEKSVSVSPMSILRQKNLANIAEKNGDIPTALKALRECHRLGKESCHGNWDDAYQFGMTTAAATALIASEEKNLPDEALKILKEATHFFGVSPEKMLCMQFLQGRLQFLSKNKAAGIAAIEKAEAMYAREIQNIDTDIARIKALQTIGLTEKSDELIHSLIQHYAYDQESLEKLDAL
jgi:CheY-like chemotaxis protein